MIRTLCKIRVHHGQVEEINKVVDLVDMGKDFKVGKDKQHKGYNIEKSICNRENKQLQPYGSNGESPQGN